MRFTRLNLLKTSLIGVLPLVVISCQSASSAQAAQDGPVYPFAAFVGEWTLKDDQFQQVWDGETVETLTIPGHYTSCQPVNTQGSILCEVDAGGFNGHIMWAYDAGSGRVHHLSHFGTSRLGTGEGEIAKNGDLNTRIVFVDEPEGTYRRYAYKWVTPDEYTMLSTQYDAADQLTGNWYGGTFIRLKTDN